MGTPIEVAGMDTVGAVPGEKIGDTVDEATDNISEILNRDRPERERVAPRSSDQERAAAGDQDAMSVDEAADEFARVARENKAEQLTSERETVEQEEYAPPTYERPPATPGEFDQAKAELNAQVAEYQQYKATIPWNQLTQDQAKQYQQQLVQSGNWLMERAANLQQIETSYKHAAQQNQIQQAIESRNRVLLSSHPELEQPGVVDDIVGYLKTEEGFTDRDFAPASWQKWDLDACNRAYFRYRKFKARAGAQAAPTLKLKRKRAPTPQASARQRARARMRDENIRNPHSLKAAAVLLQEMSKDNG